ncbi:hypothetical protein IPJ63_03335 [Candidatus Nomurabacteria bacterium]|nr:MAG: hypothetical protein IPJ63_03335 [Candidatus Nomurabacteria bacterium]
MAFYKRKYLPSQADIDQLERDLEGPDFNCVKLSNTDIRNSLAKYEKKAPRKTEGIERGFVFIPKDPDNDYRVIIWGTAKEDGGVKQSDYGWVLVLKGDKPVYFAKRMERTKNYIINIKRRAWVTIYKVRNRPHCPHPGCERFMEISKTSVIGAVVWKCENKAVHTRPYFRNWDYGLPKKAKSFVDENRKSRRRYYKKLKKENKVVEPAQFKRKKRKLK